MKETNSPPGGALMVLNSTEPPSPAMSPMTPGSGTAENSNSLISWGLPLAPADPNKTRKLRQRLGHTTAPPEYPHVRDVLDKFIPKREWEDSTGTKWEQAASTQPASRLDTVVLGEELNKRLLAVRASSTGIDPSRRMLYQECFTELIRQVCTLSKLSYLYLS